MAMTHDVGGRDHERETLGKADRILYLDPALVARHWLAVLVLTVAKTDKKPAINPPFYACSIPLGLRVPLIAD
jgi:hypothetical protein